MLNKIICEKIFVIFNNKSNLNKFSNKRNKKKTFIILSLCWCKKIFCTATSILGDKLFIAAKIIKLKIKIKLYNILKKENYLWKKINPTFIFKNLIENLKQIKKLRKK